MKNSAIRLGVAGRPILHSLSPLIFRSLLKAAGLDGAYVRVLADSGSRLIELASLEGFQGLNATAPLKEGLAALADESDTAVQALGAANIAIPRGDASLVCANSDVEGVLGPLRARGIELAGRACLVLGAGGAGRAAAYALVGAGARVTIANRTLSRARELAAVLGCQAAGFEALGALAASSDLIVSTLASKHLPDPDTWLGSGGAVFDADYREGRLEGAAKARGRSTIGGLEWLVYQAMGAWRIFFESEPPLDSSTLLDPLAAQGQAWAHARSCALTRGRSDPARRPIALIGLPGSGKSAVGRALALAASLPFVDADALIEKDAGMDIPAIFAAEGEAGFRVRERRAIERVVPELAESGGVLSVGGGAVEGEALRAFLRERCLCVWLSVPPGIAATRTAGTARPLLAGDDRLAALERLAIARRPLYAACAEMLVDARGADAAGLADMIQKEFS